MCESVFHYVSVFDLVQNKTSLSSLNEDEQDIYLPLWLNSDGFYVHPFYSIHTEKLSLLICFYDDM